MPADFLLNDRKRSLASLINRHFDKAAPEVRARIEEAVRRANPALDPKAEIAKDTVVIIPDVAGAQRKSSEDISLTAAASPPAVTTDALERFAEHLKQATRDAMGERKVELKALADKGLFETLQKQNPRLARQLGEIAKARKDDAEKAEANTRVLLEKIALAKADLARLMK